MEINNEMLRPWPWCDPTRAAACRAGPVSALPARSRGSSCALRRGGLRGMLPLLAPVSKTFKIPAIRLLI